MTICNRDGTRSSGRRSAYRVSGSRSSFSASPGSHGEQCAATIRTDNAKAARRPERRRARWRDPRTPSSRLSAHRGSSRPCKRPPSSNGRSSRAGCSGRNATITRDPSWMVSSIWPRKRPAVIVAHPLAGRCGPFAVPFAPAAVRLRSPDLRTAANTSEHRPARPSVFGGFARVRWPSRFSNQSGRTVWIGFVMRFFGGQRSFCGLKSQAIPGATSARFWTGPLQSMRTVRPGCHRNAQLMRCVAIATPRSLADQPDQLRCARPSAHRHPVPYCGATSRSPPGRAR